MENKVLVIEIGDVVTKICVSSYKKKHQVVYQTLIMKTPPGTISDGLIQNVDELAELISLNLRRAAIEVTDVIFTISSSRIASHEVIIPLVKPKEIIEYVKAGANDYFPINLSDYSLSYTILEKTQTKQEKSYRLLVLAIFSNMVMGYYELAKRMRMNVISIDHQINSIFQIIKKQPIHKEVSVFVQINEKNTLIYILNNGILKLHRTIAYGMKSSIEIVLSNIIRVLDYYSSRNRDYPVQTMYLCGDGCKLPGMEDLFSKEVGVNLVMLDDMSSVSFKQTDLQEGYKKSDFLDCIGASINPMNIVPKQYLEMVEKKSVLKETIAIGSLALIASLTLILFSSNKINEARDERIRLRKSITDLEEIENLYNENRKLSEQMNVLTAIDQACYKNTENLNDLIKEIEDKLPQNTLINSLRVTDTDIIIDVYVDSMDAAAMTFVQLNRVKLLKNVRTEQIIVETDEFGVTRYAYIVTAKHATPDKEE